MGKSRIVAELFGYVDAQPRAGDVAAGPLPAVRRGHHVLGAGRDREGPRRDPGVRRPGRRRRRSSTSCCPRARSEPGSASGCCRCWASRRRPPAEREELFTAWRRFLEHVAERDPTVLVFEDLHWADDAMLAFLEHLADRAEGVPLMIVGTARPELYEQHAEFGAGFGTRPRSTSRRCQRRRRRGWSRRCWTRRVIPAELQQPILDRAGGNPLVRRGVRPAVQGQGPAGAQGSELGAARRRRGAVPRLGQGTDRGPLGHARHRTRSRCWPMPRWWARCSGQVRSRKWASATPTVVEALRELSRKELVRPSRHSSMQGEAEYAFWHILTRDVAYNQLPRASRPHAMSPPRRGSNPGPRTRGRPGRRPRLPLRDRPGTRPRGRTSRSGSHLGGARAAFPGAGRRTSARP